MPKHNQYEKNALFCDITFFAKIYNQYSIGFKFTD